MGGTGQGVLISKGEGDNGLSDRTTQRQQQKQQERKDATTGASAAGARAVAVRMVAFYFRTPVKAFFRTRVDYLAFARAVNPRIRANEAWSLKVSSPGLLTYAVRTYGWSFIPNQILPPLLANVAIGTVLYTSYLQTLSLLNSPSSQSTKYLYPPPPFKKTFVAGFTAGAIQSIAAAPLDALQVRFETNDMLEGRYKNMWQYGMHKLSEVGFRGVFAGWGLAAIRDAMGYGVFFASFEYVKAQGFYSFVTAYYGDGQTRLRSGNFRSSPEGRTGLPTIRPHFALGPTFLLLAGISATVTQQVVQYPLGLIQDIHYGRLETLDHELNKGSRNRELLRHYRQAYNNTYAQCLAQARRGGGWLKWLYRGFLINTVKQVPGTSAGLVIFELVRRRYANEAEAVRIEKDGYEILLS